MIFEDPLEQQVMRTISHCRMITPNDRILVAVSGGPDSTVLLHVLYHFREDLGISLHVAHLNHQLRGAEAEEDARHVARLCQSLDLPFTIHSVDVPAYLESSGKSLEEGAREVRYHFLREVSQKTNCNRIAMGHNADDQVETILMNLFRGSGADGLRGIPSIRGPIIRPLLECPRYTIEDYCNRHHLSSRQDSSNLEPNVLRNRIRLELVPLLESTYKPDLRSVFLRMSRLMQEDSDFLNAYAVSMLEFLLRNRASDRLEIDREGLLQLSPAVTRRVLREGIRRIKGDLLEIGFETIESILEACSASTGFKINIPGNLFAEGISNRVLIYRAAKESERISIHYELSIPGHTPIPELQLALNTEIVSSDRNWQCNRGPWNASLDWEAITPPLIIRTRKPGDRFTPLGMKSSRKLQDYFVDRKVPQKHRDQIALIADQNEILWIPGFTISDKVKITEKTHNILQITAVLKASLPNL